MKRFWEWYFGFPPANPGEGTQWRFQSRVPWPETWPDWTVLIVLLTLAAFLSLVQWRSTRGRPLHLRCVLIALRTLAIVCVAFFLCEMTLAIDRTGLPDVVLLLDDSRSMSVTDEYADTDRRQVAESLARGVREPTRLDLARSLLLRDEMAVLRQLVNRYKLRVYRFSRSAQQLGPGEYVDENQLSALAGELEELTASGEATAPASSVRQVLNEFRGAPPAALVLFTDGIASVASSERLPQAVDLARLRRVPLFTVGLGTEAPARDIHLYDVLLDSVALVGVPLNISGKLRGFNYPGERVEVTVREQGGRVVARTQVILESPEDTQDFELVFTPEREGEFDYLIRATPLDGESNVQNNAELRHVSVRAGRIRVLLVDSVPRYEFRYLKHFLEREDLQGGTIELHVLLQDADAAYAEEDRSAIPLGGRFPIAREPLFEYDVVILGDVAISLLSPGVMQNLQEFVAEKGGGLILIAGPRHNPRALRGTPLEDLLPIQLAETSAPSLEESIRRGFRPLPTLQGLKGTPVFRLGASESSDEEVWGQLPALYWLFRAPQLKPGAVSLAETTLEGESPGLPVISMQQFGNGKVLFHATDELWRWRYRVGDLYYGRYWMQAIRYLSRTHMFGRDRAAELTTDRQVYQRGEDVELRVRFLDESRIPVEDDGVTVVVENLEGTGQRVTLTRVREAPHVFETRVPRLPEDSYHAWILRPAFQETPPSADFRVESREQELAVRALDREGLEVASAATGGRFYTLDEAHRLVNDLPPGTPVALTSHEPVQLWNRWELLILFAGLLGAEWWLRKRRGLA